MKKKQIETVLILPDIRSAINVGAIFRTADAVGVNKIYLTGYTPKPVNNFGKIQKDIAKSALGAENYVPWEYKEKIISLINFLKKDGYTIIALEQNENSIDYRRIKGVNKMAIIVGPEVEGLNKKIINKCDLIAEIKMYGQKESLNVSVACGIFLFKVLRD